MNLEALKLKLMRCLERAEEADRERVRQQWLSAAERRRSNTSREWNPKERC
jgi:hypothetical protein